MMAINTEDPMQDYIVRITQQCGSLAEFQCRREVRVRAETQQEAQAMALASTMWSDNDIVMDTFESKEGPTEDEPPVVELLDEHVDGPCLVTEDGEVVVRYQEYADEPWASLDADGKQRWLDFLERTFVCAVAEDDDRNNLGSAVWEAIRAAPATSSVTDILLLREEVHRRYGGPA
jgi:hypothetical protein